ncbi:hypothetical protein B9G53_01165 [Pseudanabaena sp. SR411]|uniref:hypothetical protein n=1 Tax=Pseudanabaena sp. SR411 TaxID=1980935 RepID=UPI000B9971E7|nr:hypothetical protein [Pseudanabaena sp. SR411]OYQ67492.1 hypothetical protein B9G53_01165 [Pseudanabaena sp. SR411]
MLLYTDVLRAALALTIAAVTAIIALWHKIIDWAQDSLFPWIEKNLPSILSTVKNAFAWVDEKVIVPFRRVVKKAWEMLRQYLLKTTIQFDRQTTSTWTKRITSFVIETLTSQSPTVKKVESVEEVDWDDLPDDVRNAWMKNERQSMTIDVTAIRDQQIETLDMTN